MTPRYAIEAQGLSKHFGDLRAVSHLELKVPLVVRLQGTRVEEGRKLLEESGLKITAADTMADAASKIVELVSK